MLSCHRCLMQAGYGLGVRARMMKPRPEAGSIVPVMGEESVGVCSH